jgi:hypothetical protein
MTKSGFKVSFNGTTATLSDGSTVDVGAVEGTTSTRALAVALRDAGRTNAEIGALMGTTSGSAGNNVVNGLRDLGRGSEVEAGSGGGNGLSKAVSDDPATVARDRLERAREALANVTDATKRADTERKALYASVKAHALDTTERDDRSPVETLVANAVDKADARVKSARESEAERRSALEAVVAKWEAAVAVLSAE